MEANEDLNLGCCERYHRLPRCFRTYSPRCFAGYPYQIIPADKLNIALKDFEFEGISASVMSRGALVLCYIAVLGSQSEMLVLTRDNGFL
jgi:hypothetical protein